MKSQTISNTNKGFTLMEALVAMGLIMIIGSLGIYFGIDNLRGYSFHGDRDALISLLQHARSESVTNICHGTCTTSVPHGVSIQANKFVMFQGTSYALANHTLDTSIDANTNITHGGISEIIFKQLSGDATTTGDIILTDTANGRTSTISINSEGQIIWTN